WRSNRAGDTVTRCGSSSKWSTEWYISTSGTGRISSAGRSGSVVLAGRVVPAGSVGWVTGLPRFGPAAHAAARPQGDPWSKEVGSRQGGEDREGRGGHEPAGGEPGEHRRPGGGVREEHPRRAGAGGGERQPGHVGGD